MGFMQDRCVLVTGVRNKWSIAWHCALSLMREGATVAYSAYSERERDDIVKLLKGAGAAESPVFMCDATKEEQLLSLMEQVSGAFDGKLDALLHAMAFAKREDLEGEFVKTSYAGFSVAMESAAYTLVGLSRAARPLMQAAGGGSVVTLTYLGSDRVVPGYNVMGVAKSALESSMRYLAYDLGPDNIRVNAVSAGPIKTLAASGVAGLSDMIKTTGERSPLRRPIDADEVGDACAFLMSPLSRGITGEVLFVDAGYHSMGY